MTPENIAGLRLPRDLTLWTSLRELDVTNEELIAQLQWRSSPTEFPAREPVERRAA